ncbi:DHA2 family efflux MFS transporter permease subunit [Fangia hongkongensis]|uniref:DHA2 family efflux MFS transporter permease subunit n=1 Tax=Fangia hongkongensis TaxID=270495 RepID=UPI000367510D|nr:DHA2 family efflux MFS transporter permease subunit [Fangia hongkongensis]MBK2126169.1 DHA2 family efflux MFS transporter permease subunit [Fangia hongkongensis]
MSEKHHTISTAAKWLITITVMLSAMIEIIDTTIVNVALKDMAGSLGASTDEISWVVTSYIVSAAICMPLTGFFVRIFGRKRLLLINIVGFLIFSMLCGLSTSLDQMVFFRIMQGIFGASLVPLSQYVLRDTFPPKEQVKAMAVWGIGIMAAPVLGPTLGGYITDWMNWRWIFYINIPVCLLAILMTLLFITETKREKVKIDWIGLALLVITISTLQIFLDRGNTDGWLSSHFILGLLLTWIIAGIIFIVRGWITPRNILNLHLFQDRNYAASCILLVLYTAGIFGMMTVQPLIMQGYMNYSASLSGELMAPRGIAAAIAMVFVTPLAKKIDLRLIILLGILITAYGNYLYAGVPLMSDPWNLTYPGIVQGIGMGFFFVPVSTMALQTLAPAALAEGSGMFSFFRNLGTSVGTSVMVTVLTQQAQVAWHSMIQKINTMNPDYHMWLQHMSWSAEDPHTLAEVVKLILPQANIIAFDDVSYLSYLLLLVAIPFIFMLKKPKNTAVSMEH